MRRLIARLLFLAALIPVSMPARAESPPSVIRIGVATAGVGGRPYCGLSYVCDARVRGDVEREFAADGTTIDWQFFPGAGPAVNEALAGGRLDFAWQGDLPAIVARSLGLKTHLLMAGNSRVDLSVAVPANSKAQSLADLKGARIANFNGTNLQIAAEKIFASVGMKPSDFQLVNLDPLTANAALVGHQVDGAVVGAWAVGLHQKGLIRYVFSTADHAPALTIQAALLVTDSFAQQHPQAVDRVVRAMLRASDWVSTPANRAAVLQEWAKSGFPESFFAEAQGSRDLAVTQSPLFDAFMVRQFTDAAAMALRLGFVRQPVDIVSWLDLQPLQAALKAEGLQNRWQAYEADGVRPVVDAAAPVKDAAR